MTEKQFEELLAVLGRIATALEQANLREMYPPASMTPPVVIYPNQPGNMSYCSACNAYYTGTIHSCMRSGPTY